MGNSDSDWEGESRERIASLETQQDNIDRRLEQLREGQEEILDQLVDMQTTRVTNDDLDDLRESTVENTGSRKRKQGALKALAALGSALAGAAGYAVVVV